MAVGREREGGEDISVKDQRNLPHIDGKSTFPMPPEFGRQFSQLMDWRVSLKELTKAIHSVARHLERMTTARGLLNREGAPLPVETSARIRRQLMIHTCAKKITIDGILSMRSGLPCDGEFDVSQIIKDAVILSQSDIPDREAYLNYVHKITHVSRPIFKMQRVLLERIKKLKNEAAAASALPVENDTDEVSM